MGDGSTSDTGADDDDGDGRRKGGCRAVSR